MSAKRRQNGKFSPIGMKNTRLKDFFGNNNSGLLDHPTTHFTLIYIV